MTDPRCPVSGEIMVRDTRPMTITYKGHSATFDMPGWYCDASGESVHSGADMKVSDRALSALKAQVEDSHSPEADTEGSRTTNRRGAECLPEV